VPPRLTIDSPQNPRVKALVKLRERRARERQGRFVVEGAREVKRALEAAVPLRELYICPSFLGPEGRELLSRVSPALEVLELSQAAFKKASQREHPDGVLAVARARELSLAALELGDDALVLVLDGLEKPGNLGALLRTADGAGVAAVFATGAGTDFYNPNVIRASMGSVFSLPALPVDGPALLGWLGARGYRIVAASPQAALSYWQERYLGRVAIVLGTEHQGLSEGWETAAHGRVKVPMRGAADSLNVATAGALLVYEALRQRLQASSD
jgi:TrmH family RNA methyltransferase